MAYCGLKNAFCLGRSLAGCVSQIPVLNTTVLVTHNFQPVRFAGHSHWQNIRHTKDAKDLLKQKMANEIVRKIKFAALDEQGSGLILEPIKRVKQYNQSAMAIVNACRCLCICYVETGGANPKLNSTLAKILDEGKSKAVPSATMQAALKRLEKSGSVKGSQIYIEARALGNCSLIVEGYTEKSKWLRQQVQHIVKQYGGRIGDSGLASSSFHFKGVVYCPVDDGKSLDEALEAAIECGAEDVQLVEDDSTFQFICDSKQLHAVRSALADHGFRIRESQQEYIPHMFVYLDSASLELADQMIQKLEDMDEISNVFCNADLLQS